MTDIYRRYGKTVEIIWYEKKPSKVRSPFTRIRRSVYGPRRLDNIRRTRTICVRRVSSAIEKFGCPLLVTLTFRGDASDAAYANDSLRFFQVRLRNAFPQSYSLFVPELSPRGRIHFHGLLFNVPMHLGDTRKDKRVIAFGTERKTRQLAKLWREGYVDARKTDGSQRLANYLAKYLTKAGDQVIFNAMRMLRISRGFPKETIYRGVIARSIKKHYAKRKPDRQWTDDKKKFEMFLGKITKKTYFLK